MPPSAWSAGLHAIRNALAAGEGARSVRGEEAQKRRRVDGRPGVTIMEARGIEPQGALYGVHAGALGALEIGSNPLGGRAARCTKRMRRDCVRHT
jgi:hypothetical protein